MKVLLSLLVPALLTASALADWKKSEQVTLQDVQTKPEYTRLLGRCKRVTATGYMKSNPQAKISDLPDGWRSVRRDKRLHEYHYSQRDQAVPGGSKEGWVILFDVEPERLAAWIANAVIETSPHQKYNEARAQDLIDKVSDASGAQFPVVGLVWEDMEGTGHAKAYGFLDGLTVLGAPAAFYQNGNRTTAKLGPDVLKQGLALQWTGGANAGKYARISSTTREEVTGLYRKMGTTAPDVTGNKFADYTRKTYIAAMDSTRNELIVATAEGDR